jgi:4-hydroxybenzoyl-CoA thioesterase/acyl-CoA thioester hydrolase
LTPPLFTTTRRVEFHDTDAAGIMHFAKFFHFMEEAEHEYLRHLGLSVLMHDAEGPISWPRVAVHCEYRSAVRFEDVVTIDVHISRRGEKSLTYQFVFRLGDRLVAEGYITCVCCRLTHQGPPVSIPIPDWISAKLPAGEAA